MFGLCSAHIVDKIKHLGLTLTKARSRRYPVVTITDEDYVDDLALMADTIADAQTLLHSLEVAARDVRSLSQCKKDRVHESQSRSARHIHFLVTT